jgi:hypothetical protein
MATIIDSKLMFLRTTVRHNCKEVINHVIQTQLIRKSIKSEEICIFCGSPNLITKEHVIPRWTFEKSTEKNFITDINGKSQTYNRTTIPACSNCNNNSLASLERYIIELLENTDLTKSFLSNYEIQNIIRWLEIIEYKFQILEVRRKFKSTQNGDFVDYLVDFPISMLRERTGYSPYKVISEIRLSQKRITIKSKSKNVNSLVVFKTKNENFHFLHNMNEFIFFELPKYKIALFYFYTETFKNNKDAFNKTMEIIEKIYN